MPEGVVGVEIANDDGSVSDEVADVVQRGDIGRGAAAGRGDIDVVDL